MSELQYTGVMLNFVCVFFSGVVLHRMFYASLLYTSTLLQRSSVWLAL